MSQLTEQYDDIATLIDHLPAGPEAGREISYEQFGVEWIHRILQVERIATMVNRIVGPTIELGPIGAGPGRQFAQVHVLGTFRECKGEVIPGEVLTFRIYLPISVVFDLDMKVDRHRFNADVVVPLRLEVHAEHPLRLRMEITAPAPEDVALNLTAETRRATILQKLAGMEGELRRFLIKVVQVEFAKPYVQRALHLDVEELVTGAWDHITEPILPRGPEDRQF